jgi:hypothetical protein
MMFGPVLVTGAVHDVEIGFWEIGRTEALKDPTAPDDEVHVYEYNIKSKKRLTDEVEIFEGLVEHRYGDGWMVLMYKVLSDALGVEASLELSTPGPGS